MKGQQINQAILDATAKKAFNFDPKTITNHKTLKSVLRRKHLGIAKASITLGYEFANFSSCVRGDRAIIPIITAIQADLGLSDEQVLQLWPQLRVWPREPYSRVPRNVNEDSNEDSAVCNADAINDDSIELKERNVA
ncbi:MAG: hypothetical protein H7A25_22355 [Leptospiraceae bacterium]|nr:hypothetical protein [Leptospiraceae bacterium]MCP5502657.1 hypothetical protein [Leptospiraceae bacterium]